MGHCRNHCRRCGGHFTSLTAFDGHLVGGDCADPDEIPGLSLSTDDGECRIGDPDVPREHVLIYEGRSKRLPRGRPRSSPATA